MQNEKQAPKEYTQVEPENLTIEEVNIILEVFHSWFESAHKDLINELNQAENNPRLFDQMTRKYDEVMYAELKKKGMYKLYFSLLTPGQKFRNK